MFSSLAIVTNMALTSILESSSSERRWINQISKILEKEVKVEIQVPVSIFRVPSTLSAFKPEAYSPQVLGLGPYHHLRPELYEMERYKLAAASRLQNRFQILKCKELVSKLNELEQEVRAYYHKYLDLDGETLTWIMAIDGMFLIEFLHGYISKKESSSSSTRTGHLVDGAGRKLAHDSILSDIMMLENQIPIFLLGKILSIQCSSADLGDNLLPSMLMDFCKALAPLKLKEDLQLSKVCDHAHLLELLYNLTVPKLEEEPQELENLYGEKGDTSFTGSPEMDLGKSNQVFTTLWSFISNLNCGLVNRIKKQVKSLTGVALKIANILPGVNTLASYFKENIKPENEVSSNELKIPIVEEIIIPSVSSLCEAGVQFCPTTGDITTISFDQQNKKFYLPVITLNVNSDVIMRNLVAYEASILPESLVFACFTELMNGIVDTAKDAKLLRQKKIIVHNLKTDAKVAELFNGMSKAVRKTNVPFMDKTIEDVNKYYYNTHKVRMYECTRKYVYSSWKFLTLLAAIFLMLLMGLQTLCSVYSCPRIFNTSNSV